ncbi:polyprenol monophosphomannose synthase [Demequina sp. NBRC 110056]|uniref:polyprenol monophosphomannose synthase n=1 Tax=Demequina sp. NBRC 110056 TaxID=1570345 RepID=UPI0009FDAE8F|nr:polyprenol monophosphomannose synthase [Demequina sp. NBRC 110056]
MVTRTLVIIPTYNERDSLPGQVDAVRAAVPDADILVVDDASPDGTGRWADARAAEDGQVSVLHRPGKQGLGAAYLAGFAWGLERGYDVLVEMDADGSHRAEDLPRVLGAPGSWDLAIGSRWIPGGAVENWPAHRRLLSTGANTYVRLMLGVPIHDATAGFRAYRADALRSLDLAGVESQGYCFQVDMAWRVVKDGGTVVEVPITFVEREQGQSKMSGAIIREALVKVTAWGMKERATQMRRAFGGGSR